ncbi:hypothetical protein [Dankookia sp. P2]|uniref:hypothetical protein n=1 Tax=Dankookia sp. P2 TaxID=3423955 RepID=UPI003D66FD33
MTDALAQDRARARDPLVLRSVAAPGTAGRASPDESAMPAAPPRRATLAAAPAVPWTEAPGAPARQGPQAPAGAGAAPAAPAPALPEMPAEAPAAPPPELLGPPPLPR